VGRRVAADWRGAPLAPAVPRRGAARKNGRFCWATGGCRGLQMGDGVKKMPLETMGGNLGAPGPGKFPPVFRPRILPEAAQQRGRKSNGKHLLKRQFTPEPAFVLAPLYLPAFALAPAALATPGAALTTPAIPCLLPPDTPAMPCYPCYTLATPSTLATLARPCYTLLYPQVVGGYSVGVGVQRQ
jgi:hypothetical protein